jgi:formylglycine-generating enzyme required for sulfatase activity
MAGNVWDWTADLFRIKSLSKASKTNAADMRGYRLIKGGSYLCHASYCTRYRIAARTENSLESSTSHTGFRIVFDQNW